MNMIFTPNPIGALLRIPEEIRINNFQAPNGISGLARVSGRKIDILAVVSENPGKGHFRAFIASLKQDMDSIVFWHVWNLELDKALRRYGFFDDFAVHEDGHVSTTLSWDRFCDEKILSSPLTAPGETR